MDSVQQARVREIAAIYPANTATSNAQAVLRWVYKEEFPLQIINEQNRSIPVTKALEEKQTQSEKGILGTNYPNPAGNSTQIPYYLEKGCSAQLVLSNGLGKQVGVYLLQEGFNIQEIVTEHFSEGIYFYTLVVDGLRVESKKMIVIHE